MGTSLSGISASNPLAHRGDRMVGVFVHRAAGDVEVGDLLVEEAGQQPHQPALGLPLLAQEEHVVPGDQAQVDFRDRPCLRSR